MAILLRIFLLLPLLSYFTFSISSAHYDLPEVNRVLHGDVKPARVHKDPTWYVTHLLHDRYFINCGSDANITVGRNRHRIYIGDVNPGLSISPGKSKVVKDNTISKSIQEIYYTARVYERPAWYVFHQINRNSTHLVRLHFFPLSSQTFPHLHKARFDVWASSGHQLLSNFSPHDSLEKTPTVKEFIMELKEGIFGIHFSPSMGSPVAFINAIEIFLGSQGNKPNSTYPVSPELRIINQTEIDLVSDILQPTYRINVGGSFNAPEDDSLWRTWLPDDDFLAIPAAAENITYNGSMTYGVVTTIFTAPIFVYLSAKELKMGSSGSNLTWVFKVKKKTKYFVNLMWCYIMEGIESIPFDYFIGSNRTSVGDSDPLLLARPLRYEAAIVSDSSGVLKIGIAPNEDFPGSRPFLNGIEIMELIDKSSSGPIFNWVEESKQRNYLFIGLLVGGIVISTTLVIGLILFYFRTRKSRDRHRRYQEFLSQDKQSAKISITDLAPNLNLDLKISFAEIQEATNNFDEEKVIGIGGFGKVYSGIIRSKEVAIKRSRPGFGQGMREFQTEIIILSQIRHRFLVSLYGYCDENEEMILVYEFMERGTLKQYLYGSNPLSRPFLSWKQRLQICIDAAKGLDYLHRGSAGGVITHRDIKTTNILVDGNWRAKVGDFGISKSRAAGLKEVYSTIKGTYGYLDPEYFNTGQLTEKSDVYAFGVVLFEVVAGRAPIVQTLPHEEINLAEWAVMCKSKGEIEKLIDPLLVGTIMEPNSLQKWIELAEKCVDEVGAKRPSMREVVSDLEVAKQIEDGGTVVGGREELPYLN